MLKTFLFDLRKSRILSESTLKASVGALSPEWAASTTALERTFEFPSFELANGFMQSYSEQCAKVGREPALANVYNRVTVTLRDAEFDGVSSKDLELASYLDRVHSAACSMSERIEEDLFGTPRIDADITHLLNDQRAPTAIPYRRAGVLEERIRYLES